MMNSFQNKNIYLCLENVRNNHNLKQILNLDLDNVKMCFDLGHAHCYDNVEKLFNETQSHIICAHIHNNHGTDEHLIPNQGEINYQYYINLLKQIKNCSICLECFPSKNSILNKDEFTKFIKACFNSVNI